MTIGHRRIVRLDEKGALYIVIDHVRYYQMEGFLPEWRADSVVRVQRLHGKRFTGSIKVYDVYKQQYVRMGLRYDH